MSEFRDIRFSVDMGETTGKPRILSFCIRVPAGRARERLLHHPDAIGLSPYVFDEATLRRRALRREILLRQAEMSEPHG